MSNLNRYFNGLLNLWELEVDLEPFINFLVSWGCLFKPKELNQRFQPFLMYTSHRVYFSIIFCLYTHMVIHFAYLDLNTIVFHFIDHSNKPPIALITWGKNASVD